MVIFLSTNMSTFQKYAGHYHGNWSWFDVIQCSKKLDIANILDITKSLAHWNHVGSNFGLFWLTKLWRIRSYSNYNCKYCKYFSSCEWHRMRWFQTGRTKWRLIDIWIASWIFNRNQLEGNGNSAFHWRTGFYRCWKANALCDSFMNIDYICGKNSVFLKGNSHS